MLLHVAFNFISTSPKGMLERTTVFTRDTTAEGDAILRVLAAVESLLDKGGRGEPWRSAVQALIDLLRHIS